MAKASGGTYKSVPKKKGGGYSFEKETEKAVLAKVQVSVEYAPKGGFTSSLVKDKTINADVWLPKSQFEDGNPTNWILKTKATEVANNKLYNSQILDINYKFYDGKGKEIKGIVSKKEKEWAKEKEAKYLQGKNKHDNLLQEAKSLGIKGVHQKMKTSTLEKKINEYKKKT